MNSIEKKVINMAVTTVIFAESNFLKEHKHEMVSLVLNLLNSYSITLTAETLVLINSINRVVNRDLIDLGAFNTMRLYFTITLNLAKEFVKTCEGDKLQVWTELITYYETNEFVQNIIHD